MKAIYFEVTEEKKQRLNVQLAVLGLKMSTYGNAIVDMLLRYPEESAPIEKKIIENIIRGNQ